MQSSQIETSTGVPGYIALFRHLVDRIRGGEWKQGRLPTVRNLAVEYGVSPYTAQKAVQLLQHEGLIVTKDRSGCFVAAVSKSKQKDAAAGPWAIVLRVSPGPGRVAAQEVTLIGFDKLATEEGVLFVPVPFEFNSADGNSDPETAVRTAVAAGAKGVIFVPSRISDVALRQDEVFLEKCRQSNLPVVLVDRNLRGEARPLTNDLVTSDQFNGGRVCTQHLIEIGRRRIACVLASPTSSHFDRLAGYLFALGTNSPSGSGALTPLIFHVPEELDQTAAYRWLADQVLASQADAVVCYQDYTAVGLILELLLRGKTVPGDVAVVGCDDLAIGNSFSLGVTTYTYPSAEIARWAVRLMINRIAHPEDPPAKLALPGRLIVRNSTVQEPQQTAKKKSRP
ncbi:MAG TPA: GntR family transcriptional regulator [Planctomicrobium sp.]|nr:GntR family transcriptional regulator [Planctomicrobium sp.]